MVLVSTKQIGIALTNVFVFTDLFTGCNAGFYCPYRPMDNATYNYKYCDSGCCSELGEEHEICCSIWTFAVILGVSVASVGFIALVSVIVICCYALKKRGRKGQKIKPMNLPQHLKVCTSATVYSHPHPPSGFYPNSRFPGSGYNTAHASIRINQEHPPTDTQKERSEKGSTKQLDGLNK